MCQMKKAVSKNGSYLIQSFCSQKFWFSLTFQKHGSEHVLHRKTIEKVQLNTHLVYTFLSLSKLGIVLNKTAVTYIMDLYIRGINSRSLKVYQLFPVSTSFPNRLSNFEALSLPLGSVFSVRFTNVPNFKCYKMKHQEKEALNQESRNLLATSWTNAMVFTVQDRVRKVCQL